jgi:hypothetical protein
VRNALAVGRALGIGGVGVDLVEVAGKAGKANHIGFGDRAAHGDDFLTGAEFFKEHAALRCGKRHEATPGVGGE